MNYRRGLFKIGTAMKEASTYIKKYKDCWGYNNSVKSSRWKETQQSAKNYFAGIVLPGKRKNMSRISRRVAVDHNSLQQFISDSPWDHKEIMKRSTMIMCDKTASSEGVLIVDDTGQVKQGGKSPGVARQYSGTLGKTGNCQVAVACIYAHPDSHRNADAVYWPTGIELYIPEEWFEDTKRLKECGTPEDLRFQTKPEIALELIDRVREKKMCVPHCAIVSDTSYGTNGNFRRALREWKEPYALAVTPSHITVIPEDTQLITPRMKSSRGQRQKYPHIPLDDMVCKSAIECVDDIPKKDWKTIMWSEGTKGKLQANFVRLRVRVVHKGLPTDETGWLLLERTKDNELKAYICWGLDDAPMEVLVKLIHSRWVVEQCFKQMKQELGLAQFEGRKWKGWHHHIAMVMIAFCYLMLLRTINGIGEEQLPTLPQVSRELLRLHTRRFIELRFNLSPKEAEKALDDLPFLIPE